MAAKRKQRPNDLQVNRFREENVTGIGGIYTKLVEDCRRRFNSPLRSSTVTIVAGTVELRAIGEPYLLSAKGRWKGPT